jgi:hypothetical protein
MKKRERERNKFRERRVFAVSLCGWCVVAAGRMDNTGTPPVNMRYIARQRQARQARKTNQARPPRDFFVLEENCALKTLFFSPRINITLWSCLGMQYKNSFLLPHAYFFFMFSIFHLFCFCRFRDLRIWDFGFRIWGLDFCGVRAVFFSSRLFFWRGEDKSYSGWVR